MNSSGAAGSPASGAPRGSGGCRRASRAASGSPSRMGRAVHPRACGSRRPGVGSRWRRRDAAARRSCWPTPASPRRLSAAARAAGSSSGRRRKGQRESETLMSIMARTRPLARRIGASIARRFPPRIALRSASEIAAVATLAGLDALDELYVLRTDLTVERVRRLKRLRAECRSATDRTGSRNDRLQLAQDRQVRHARQGPAWITVLSDRSAPQAGPCDAINARDVPSDRQPFGSASGATDNRARLPVRFVRNLRLHPEDRSVGQTPPEAVIVRLAAGERLARTSSQIPTRPPRHRPQLRPGPSASLTVSPSAPLSVDRSGQPALREGDRTSG